MAHEPSKMSGYTDKLTGGIKETTGKVLGNQEMRAEGLAKKEKGKSEIQAAKAEQQTIGTGEKMKGGLKEGVGNVTGNERMRAEGQADRIKGDIRKDTNIWSDTIERAVAVHFVLSLSLKEQCFVYLYWFLLKDK